MDRPASSESLPPHDVIEQVERIVASVEFQASDRNRALLRYVADETLAGREFGLKAYSIACNVFGRAGGFDAGADRSVRSAAGQVRRALER